MSLKTLVGSGSGSEIQKKKFGSGSGINHSGSATLISTNTINTRSSLLCRLDLNISIILSKKKSGVPVSLERAPNSTTKVPTPAVQVTGVSPCTQISTVYINIVPNSTVQYSVHKQSNN